MNSQYASVVLCEAPQPKSEMPRILSVCRMKRVNVDFPLWMVRLLDKEARRLGVPRQSIIKVWISERLEQAS